MSEGKLKPCPWCGKKPTKFGAWNAYKCEPCMKDQGWFSEKDWNTRSTDPRDAALNKAREALEALGSEYPDGELCFCDMRIGNPLTTSHSKSCIKAREALAGIEKVGK